MKYSQRKRSKVWLYKFIFAVFYDVSFVLFILFVLFVLFVCGVGDKGIDIFCQVADRIVFLIQCKNYSRKGLVGRDIVYAHIEVTRRCAKKYGVAAVGIVVIPSMDSFSADAKEAAETAEGVVVFLSTKHQISRYILPSVVNSRTGALTHFILP
ncbi:hypothetical protein C2G38_2048319 [Gigaspora rosea]|uniref:Restriction endonuclease type IV Mrr domain-containing protein n=1 Tax=Gigaspora rosea TaxID=44941 RepID=A0A397U699_9GLOM|nr:hypothetical protein C2G38_2048319 [Gigaspora rosea]